MTDFSYKDWTILSDAAIEKEIGLYIKKTRQQQNKTQQDLADAAGISRSTLSLLERGESGNLKTLIQVLRVLGQLHVFRLFEYIEVMSPMALAEQQHKYLKTRERVRHKKPSTTSPKKRKSDW